MNDRMRESSTNNHAIKNNFIKMKKQSIIVRSPGRINIIGEHTDYNEGYVLPAAIDKQITVHLEVNGSPAQASVTAKNLNESYSFDVNNTSPQAKGWQNYVLGVVHELRQLGATISGFNASFEGDIPIGGGLSSSAALECCFAFALNEVFELGFTKNQLIHASQMAEHHFAGVKCGIMDQFSSLMGKKGHVLLLDCRSLDYEYFPMSLGKYEILLLNTNVSHSLASSEYNTRRKECEQGVEIIKKEHPVVKSLRDASLQQLMGCRKDMTEKVFLRCTHVISENQRVMDATAALSKGDLFTVGKLIYRSHFSLQHDYEVSCAELDFLVKKTLDKEFIVGSRMMGGGFGGCTLNIVESAKVDEFIDYISPLYLNEFGKNLTPYRVSIEDGTSEVLE
jgi:galactokinase